MFATVYVANAQAVQMTASQTVKIDPKMSWLTKNGLKAFAPRKAASIKQPSKGFNNGLINFEMPLAYGWSQISNNALRVPKPMNGLG